jgi:hypothetical protein
MNLLAINPLLLFLLPLLISSKHHQHDDDDNSKNEECSCKLLSRPDKAEKSLTARWMVHSLDWGVLSTISTRLGDGSIPFGNIYSFVDGTCHNSTGIPYLYGTYLDQSLTDSLENPMVSLTLSEASLSSVCSNRDGLDACSLRTKYGDPENPVCARLTLTGELVVLEESSDEYVFSKQSLFERHSSMAKWPENHEWVIAKIVLQDIWLIDYFGGAAILTPEQYFAANLVDELEDKE